MDQEKRFVLVIKRPGSLLSKVAQMEITQEQTLDVIRLLSEPGARVVSKPAIGFKHA